MRMLDEEYQVGDIFVDKETGERYVCLETRLCEDTYFDKIYVVSEEEYLENESLTLFDSEVDSLMSIEGYELDDYDWIQQSPYQPYIQTAYCFARK